MCIQKKKNPKHNQSAHESILSKIIRLSNENEIVAGATAVPCLTYVNIFGLVLLRAYVALGVSDKRKLFVYRNIYYLFITA